MPNANTRLDFALELDFSQILTNPILDIAARIWDHDRYEAFRICYRSMRRIDDLVDHRKAGAGTIAPAEARVMESMIADWLASVRKGLGEDDYQKEFLKTCTHFLLPLWPWERLCHAMVYDLHHNGFATFTKFLRYVEGAAVAPAAVFMHLCGITRNGSAYAPPRFDIRRVSRPLALFSYLVHIMRDFEKDQNSALNYFPDALLTRHGLTVAELRSIAASQTPTPRFRSLMTHYKQIAERYRREARAVMDATLPLLEPRYQLSWELIYNLYFQIFERIDPERGLFTAPALNPSPNEVQTRIQQTIDRFVPVQT